jgi:hypothetical protein
MQNVNKFAAAGDQQQQENNYRTGTHLVTPPVRIELGWSNRRPSQIPKPAVTWQQDEDRRPTQRRMSYHSTERQFRDDERDDALVIGRRDDVVKWNRNHSLPIKESAFIAVSYHGEKRRNVPRGGEQLPWRPVTEREWRRPLPSGVLRESTAVPTREQLHSVASAPWASSRSSSSPLAFRSASWSRGGFPTVAKINNHNQMMRVKSGRGGSHAQHGIPREVQTASISMSSSNGSSTTASVSASCRSPSDSKLGEKRYASETLASPPASTTPPLPPQLGSAKKRLKPSPASSTGGARFDMLDLLCSATLEMGPLQDNPSGCSCPKSKCIALYCDCFKAGRRCSPGTCTCLNCKNTVAESGVDGARTKAIRTILARNPRAFTTAGMGPPPKAELPPGQVACNCIRSRCLKLYCGCFQAGKACDPKICTCIGCLNTEEDVGGQRRVAIQQCLEKRPNAFQVKPKEVGMGCACKNNRCKLSI